MGTWFQLARAKARELGVDHQDIFKPLQGKRSQRHDEIKRARLEVARYLKTKDATNAEIGKVLGGITASVVSRMLKKGDGDG